MRSQTPAPIKMEARLLALGLVEVMFVATTQVVWAGANEIGCGVSSCSLANMPGYQLTCQYRSTIAGKFGGNMQGSNLFTKGAACSSCPSGHTQCTTNPAGLCSDGSSPNATPAPDATQAPGTMSASSQKGTSILAMVSLVCCLLGLFSPRN